MPYTPPKTPIVPKIKMNIPPSAPSTPIPRFKSIVSPPTPEPVVVPSPVVQKSDDLKFQPKPSNISSRLMLNREAEPIPVEPVKPVRDLLATSAKTAWLNRASSMRKSQEKLNVQPIIPKPQKNWQNHFPITETDYFEVTVTEKAGNFLWVMKSDWEKTATKLLKNTFDQITVNSPGCELSEVKIGEVFAALYEDIFYRVIITEEINPLNQIGVRLIDYGNTFYVTLSDLKQPILEMKNLNSFAFLIDCKTYDVGDKFMIKLTGEKNKDGAYEIVLKDDKPYPEISCLQLFDFREKTGSICISNLLTTKRATVSFSSQSIKELAQKLFRFFEDPKFDNSNELFKIGDFVCGKVANIGWMRGIILAEHKNMYIISCIDSGTIEVITNIKMIPVDLKNIPFLSVVMEIDEITIDQNDFLENYFITKSELKCENISYNIKDDSSTCTLTINGLNVARATLTKWNGKFDELGVSYWKEPIEKGTLIHLSTVYNSKSVYICPVDKIKFYNVCIQELAETAEYYKSMPRNEEIILSENKQIKKWSRCLVLSNISDDSSRIVNLDEGHITVVKFNEMKKCPDFLKFSSVFSMKISLKDVTLPNGINEMEIVDYLKNLMEKSQEFVFSYNGTYKNGCFLMYEGLSLNKMIIKDLTKPEPIIESIIENNLNDMNISSSKVQKYGIDDIEVKLLPIKNDLELIVLDYSHLKELGSITACEFNISEYTNIDETWAIKIAEHCNMDTIPYKPE